MSFFRSTYTFELKCKTKLVDKLIQNYLQANNFELVCKNGKEFYQVSDDMIIEGYRYFSYSFSEQILTISVWINRLLSKLAIEKNIFSNITNSYKNSLNTLFEEIDKLNEKNK